MLKWKVKPNKEDPNPHIRRLSEAGESRAVNSFTFMRDTEKDIEDKESLLVLNSSSLTWATFTAELKRLGWLAGPMVTVNLAQNLLEVISTMMVGHLGELALSSTAIALSLCCVTGFNLLVSLSSYP